MRIRTLVLIRWIAVTGQAAAILFVHFLLNFPLPLMLALGIVGVSALLNILVTVNYSAATRLSDRGATLYLGYDIFQLAGLLFLTGGLGNPFALLFLVPVTVSATILSLRSAIVVGVLALTCVTLLAPFHMPLPWRGEDLVLTHTYMAGIWVALTLGILFTMGYSWRVALEGRRMSQALAETQSALAREHELSALGGLAAAAAHELGTPLGTISLVAKELSREIAPDAPFREDIDLLRSQAERCREILAKLTQRPESDMSDSFNLLPVSGLIEAAAEDYLAYGKDILVRTAGTAQGAQPLVSRSPEIVQGLANLIENAVDFATDQVQIVADWNERSISIAIHDDGPGIQHGILHKLGEPYLSTRPDDGGMGLGVFIAKTLLERTGARLTFQNAPQGGATVEISWPRPILEETSCKPRPKM